MPRRTWVSLPNPRNPKTSGVSYRTDRKRRAARGTAEYWGRMLLGALHRGGRLAVRVGSCWRSWVTSASTGAARALVARQGVDVPEQARVSYPPALASCPSRPPARGRRAWQRPASRRDARRSAWASPGHRMGDRRRPVTRPKLSAHGGTTPMLLLGGLARTRKGRAQPPALCPAAQPTIGASRPRQHPPRAPPKCARSTRVRTVPTACPG